VGRALCETDEGKKIDEHPKEMWDGDFSLGCSSIFFPSSVSHNALPTFVGQRENLQD